jgi:hypothetical protein
MGNLVKWARIGVFAVIAVVALVSFSRGHIEQGLGLVPALLLISPEIMGSWGWLSRRWRARVYRTDDNERFYLYRLTNIRARDEGAMVWFVARHIGDALEMKDFDRALASLPAAHKRRFGGDLFVSESGVLKLIEASRNPEAGKFKLFFTREIMFPIQKQREHSKSG